ncbi:MAG: hypothetical protein JRI23_15125, partial [Deltaproteobacteria bacterium]|nr:hypothetical protein [Deltaproteobacteria bacterium]MBW2533080.1 hypothetical protein [Deltaproteobacteria bacterium]
CTEHLDSCLFEAEPYGDSCQDVCSDGGVDCDDGFEPSPPGSCDPTGDTLPCDAPTYSSTICKCLKTCNGGLACTIGDVCSNSGCAAPPG